MALSSDKLQKKKSAKYFKKAVVVFKTSNSLQQWLIIIHWWCPLYPVRNAGEEAEVVSVDVRETIVTPILYFYF